MDKDKVLPTIEPLGNCEYEERHRACFLETIQAQRDADWERVKPLIGAIEDYEEIRRALAQVGVEVSDAVAE